jgi:hypothetical protein
MHTDISLCAPFLAFDPVMQFVVGVAVMPAACYLMEVGCDEVLSLLALIAQKVQILTPEEVLVGQHLVSSLSRPLRSPTAPF